jgi:hypothetical protein
VFVVTDSVNHDILTNLFEGHQTGLLKNPRLVAPTTKAAPASKDPSANKNSGLMLLTSDKMVRQLLETKY